jgi:hypothetical protein
VVKACYKLEGRAGSRPDEINEFFSIYLLLPAALGTRVYTESKRYDYQRQKNVCGE